MKFLTKSLLQSAGTKAPNGIRKQSLYQIGIVCRSIKHNILSKRMLGGFKKCTNFEIVFTL